MMISPIPSPIEIKKRFSLSHKGQSFLKEAREQSRHIVSGKDSRKAFIIGPCSIHDKTSALEYAKRFKKLASEVEETSLLIMRVYFEKSRTSTGWKGLLYDPHLDGTHDMQTGLLWTRELLLMLSELEVPMAAECVDPLAAGYFDDLITWGFIGARTSASQPHRQYASSLQIPVGFKNSTDGNLDDAIHGIAASCISHTFLFIDQEGKLSMKRSEGNPYAHIVLRGANEFTNYDVLSVSHVIDKLEKSQLTSRIMIDCSHGNCQKQWQKQKDVFLYVLDQIEQGNQNICGLMLESHLKSGFQPLCEDRSFLAHDVSITDPCIDWETTEELIYSAHRTLSVGCSSLLSR
jgi:3-deoxy-7-phosphoheptulonate synthase